MSSIVAEKSYHFAVRIVRMTRALKKRHVERELLSQLLRSGTSVAANLHEAVYGNSRGDFLYRIRIALKECAETHMWLRLLHDLEDVNDKEYQSICEECEELLKMMTAISVTMQKSEASPPPPHPSA